MHSFHIKYFNIVLLIALAVLMGCAGSGDAPVILLDEQVAPSPDVIVYRGKDYTAYQAEQVRVYFSPWLFVGIDGFEEGSRDELVNFYYSCLNDLGVLFRTGLVTGEMFYENYNGYRYLAPSTEFSVKKLDFDPVYAQDVTDFKGRTVNVLYYEQGEDPVAPYVISFHVWVQLNKADDEWGSIDHYEMVLTVPNILEKEFSMRFQGATLMELNYIRE